MIRALAIVLMLLHGSVAFSKQKTLRFSVSSTWPMPYGEIKDGALVAGLMYDFAIEISKALDLPPEFIILPRNRTELGAIERAYDVRCHLAKGWAKDPDLFIWSEPLFEISTIIVGSKGTPPLKKLSDLKGKVIGTVLGYQYPDLQDLFNKGDLQRDDSENQAAVYLKLVAGHSTYGITDKVSFDYFLKKSGNRKKFAPWTWQISSDQSYCAILKRSKVDPEKIKKAIDRLKKAGVFDRIMENYR